MGKWAQARKRGSGSRGQTVTGPPPQPVNSLISGHVLQLAQGATDTGGTCILEISPTGLNEFAIYGSQAWTASVDWGLIADLDAGDYRSKEIGNGTTYVGDSPYSSTFAI